MPSSTDKDIFKSSPIEETPPPPVQCIVNRPRIVTREHNNGMDELTDDRHSYQSNGRSIALPRNLEIECPHKPLLPATHHIKMVRVPKEWLPSRQQQLFQDDVSTTFTNGVFTHAPALVYKDIDQLISDLTPSEHQKWRPKINEICENSSIGMIARFFPTHDLKLLPVKGTSLEEECDQFFPFFGGGEGFRAEHLTEITIE